MLLSVSLIFFNTCYHLGHFSIDVETQSFVSLVQVVRGVLAVLFFFFFFNDIMKLLLRNRSLMPVKFLRV